VAKHQRADETQQRVLSTSAALFAERGYLGTSVNDLLEHAGLTKNAFYSYFPSKEALALAIVEHTSAQWPPIIAAFEVLRAPAVDTVVALSFEVADRLANDVIVRAGIRLALERETIKTPIPPPFHGWVEEIERLLSPAGEWELMGLAAPAEVAARVVVTCLIGAHYLASDSDSDMAKRLAEVWTIVLPGLRPTPDPAARIAAGQLLRDRARAVVAASAATTMMPVLQAALEAAPEPKPRASRAKKVPAPRDSTDQAAAAAEPTVVEPALVEPTPTPSLTPSESLIRTELTPAELMPSSLMPAEPAAYLPGDEVASAF
jgi:AcrR family transcriptional regulator